MRLSNGELKYLATRGAMVEALESLEEGRTEVAAFYKNVLEALDKAKDVRDVIILEP